MEIVLNIIEYSMLPVAIFAAIYSLVRLTKAVAAKKDFTFFVSSNRGQIIKILLEQKGNLHLSGSREKIAASIGVTNKELAEKIDAMSNKDFESMLSFLCRAYENKDAIGNSHSKIIQKTLFSGDIPNQKRYIEDIILAH
jgi:hypothetical protein